MTSGLTGTEISNALAAIAEKEGEPAYRTARALGTAEAFITMLLNGDTHSRAYVINELKGALGR